MGECGLECSGEFKGVPVGEKLCPLVGLWITLGVKLEIEPISEADPVLILEKSAKDKRYTYCYYVLLLGPLLL